MRDEQRTLVIDTPAAMAHFAMCQVISRLKIETSTGMKFRQSTLKHAQEYYGVKARTKVKALEEMLDLYEATYGRRYGQR